ncbi:MAG: nucleoside triphosphate pyrophosphatase [Bdellovibrionales bacterium]
MQVILASGSPYRKAQLENFGLRFEAHIPRVNEDELKRRGPTDLVELTRFLALEKAQSLRAGFPNAVLLGSDQLVEWNGSRFDKPGTPEAALAQLSTLQGRTHRLITSLAVLAPAQAALHFTDITEIRLRPLGLDDLKAYIALDQPLDCAGSYKIERAGMGLIETIESRDPSAIQGLPLISLTAAFCQLGIPLAKLWRTP